MWTKTKACRACGHSFEGEELVFSLEPQHIATYFVGKDPVPTAKKFPLELFECPECTLVQLSGTVDRELLFRNYWYKSSISNTMRSHLEYVAKEAKHLIPIGLDDIVVDIGANDGTFLSYFHPAIRRVAYEPSQMADLIPADIEVHQDFFPTKTLVVGYERRTHATLITAIAMFYDLDDPKGFLAACRDILLPEGLICLEVAYWPKLMRMGAFDTICHEHLTYFSLASLIYIAEQVDLKPHAVFFDSTNGASMRLYLKRADSPLKTMHDFAELLAEEKEIQMPWPYFTLRASEACEQTLEYLIQCQVEGKNVSLLGASTEGNVFLQAAGLHGGLLRLAWERDLSKHGLITLGTGISIWSEEHDRHFNNVKLVMPWHFLPEIVEREMEYLKTGGEIVAALPSFRRINVANWELQIENFKREVGDAPRVTQG